MRNRKPNFSKTKTGRKRKGNITARAERLVYRDIFWNPLRERLQKHFETYGAKRQMSRVTGIPDSMLHQYTCPICEHDTEPCFSLAMAILTYLNMHDEKMKAIQISAHTKIEPPDVTDEVIDSVLQDLYLNPPPPSQPKVRFTRNRIVFSN